MAPRKQTQTMGFSELPTSAAWRHVGAREGFETVFIAAGSGGWTFDGHTTAVEEGRAWTVRYRIDVGLDWCGQSAHVWGWTDGEEHHRLFTSVGPGRWEVDGRPVRDLDGCLDIDLESSACTNTFPVHRLGPVSSASAPSSAPAVYVRALDLSVERLEQTYKPADDGGRSFAYEAPGFGFACRFHYDESGLVVDYPGIATRAR